MKSLTYAIVGCGGVGAYYGARLAQAGKSVHFLLRSDFETVQQRGWYIRSYQGDFTIEHPNIYRDSSTMPKADVVIVALKTTQTEIVGKLIAPLLKTDSIVILAQNGIGVEAAVQAQLPKAQLIAGVAFISSTKREAGVIDHEQNGRITLAPFSLTDTQKLSQVVEDFEEASVPVFTQNYALARWQKALWNLPFNGLSVLLQQDCSELCTRPTSLPIVRGVMEEVLALAQATGCTALTTAHIDRTLEATRKMRPYLPSMRVDFDEQRPMELTFFYDTTLRIAAKLHIDMPLTAGLYAQLKMLETSTR